MGLGLITLLEDPFVRRRKVIFMTPKGIAQASMLIRLTGGEISSVPKYPTEEIYIREHRETLLPRGYRGRRSK